jgi:hypothetical protein
VQKANQSVVKGYNSDYKKKANVQFNEDASWTESWRLADVPRVWEDGALYREFQLDINQNKSGTDALISIDQLQVWLTNERMHDEKVDPHIVTYPFDANPDFHFVWGLDEVDVHTSSCTRNMAGMPIRAIMTWMRTLLPLMTL